MFKVTVMYFNENSRVIPMDLNVMAGSKDEAVKMTMKIYKNKKAPEGLKLAGVIAW
ncbi:hypothetical protein [Acetobacterium sp.]|uniref:hypothetical protein n=1 Tax=Acetobacterium sp. TaxID=1872094 RepID=UPI0027160B58|nr:hypothetical protein [Acetobacterium sp.]MDO9492484.1 hypothetical protein [Acetobacterium sp.]